MSNNIVIVGAGQAGVAVAFKLRSYGHTGLITLVEAESVLPYHRPPLSKRFITDRLDAERMYIKQAALYEQSNIAFVKGCTAVSINPGIKCVDLSNGQSVAYDVLVLATGSRARNLPDPDQPPARNVRTLRTLDDAQWLREAFLPGARLLVIGGGYIGLESAAVARSLGMNVTLIERDPRILGRVASAETAAYFRALHQAHGVTVHEGVNLTRFEYAGERVTAVELSDGSRLAVDVVIVGIGVAPNTDLAAHAGLHIENGIAVDRSCRTSDASIYALGDCASFPSEGRMIRLESVQNAVDMAEVVACAITGDPKEYVPVPWFWSDQYATKLQIAGLNTGYTRTVVRENHAGSLSIWYFAGDRLVAVDAINDARAFMTAKRLLAQCRSPNSDMVRDTSIELNALSPV